MQLCRVQHALNKKNKKVEWLLLSLSTHDDDGGGLHQVKNDLTGAILCLGSDNYYGFMGLWVSFSVGGLVVLSYLDGNRMLC